MVFLQHLQPFSAHGFRTMTSWSRCPYFSWSFKLTSCGKDCDVATWSLCFLCFPHFCHFIKTPTKNDEPCRHLSLLKRSEFQPMRLEQLFVVTRDPPSGTTKEIERHRTTFAATAHVTRHDVCRAAECGPLPLKLWRAPGKQKAARNGREWKKHLKKTKGSENLRYLFSFFLTAASSNQPFCFKNFESAPAAAHCLRLPAKHQR